MLSLFFFESSTPSLAQGNFVCDRPLPKSQSRKWSNHRLVCSSSSDAYLREPPAYERGDLRTAQALLKQGDKEGAQRILRQVEKEIEWSGTIPYQTIEIWNWVDWVYGQDSSCGYDRVQTGTDSDGNPTYTDVMRSCWHDEGRSERRHCSHEEMAFSAAFERPTQSQWGPDSPAALEADPLKRYLFIRPDIYTLQPGEVENIAIFNTRGGIFGGDSGTLSPAVDYGNAYHKYSESIRFVAGPSDHACRKDTDYEIDVKITTLRRILREAPNPFRLPVDRFGRSADPFDDDWQEVKKGDETHYGRPRTLVLMDQTAFLFDALADDVRSASAEMTMARLDESETAPPPEDFQYNETTVRVRLFEHSRFAADMRYGQAMTPRGEGVKRRDTRHLEDVYTMDLAGDTKEDFAYFPSAPFRGLGTEALHRRLQGVPFFGFDVWPKKGKSYYFTVDIKKPEGFPLYKEGWSKDLHVRMPQDEKSVITVDNRSVWQKLHYFWSRSYKWNGW